MEPKRIAMILAKAHAQPPLQRSQLSQFGFSSLHEMNCDIAKGPAYLRWNGRVIEDECECCVDFITDHASDSETGDVSTVLLNWSSTSFEQTLAAVRAWLDAVAAPERQEWLRQLQRWSLDEEFARRSSWQEHGRVVMLEVHVYAARGGWRTGFSISHDPLPNP